MRRYFVSVIGIFLAVGFCSAQPQGADAITNLSSLGSGDGMFRSFDNRSKGLEGSPFAFKDFMPGKVTLVDGRNVLVDNMNFDAFRQELVVIKAGKEKGVNQNVIKSFEFYPEIDNKVDTLRFDKVVNVQGRFSLVESLVPGAFSLYRERGKKIKGPTNTGPYSSGTMNSELEDTEKFMVSAPGVALTEIKNRKSLVELLPSYSEQIEEICKEKKVNFKDEEDMKVLFAELNRLQP